MSSMFSSPEPAHPEALPEDSPVDRIERLIAIHPWLAPDVLVTTARNIVNANAGFKSRWRHLIALADSFNAAIGDVATCRKGCSYCCSMPTLIYRHEAVILSRASGREPVELAFRSRQQVLAEIKALPLRPCPFLVGGRCSVYSMRPMICRLHNSFNANQRDCDLEAPRVFGRGVVAFDPDLIELSYHALILGHTPQAPWGTIHEFFPG